MGCIHKRDQPSSPLFNNQVFYIQVSLSIATPIGVAISKRTNLKEKDIMTNVKIKEDVTKYTEEEIRLILDQAKSEATNSAYYEAKRIFSKYGTYEVGACGFAWVSVYNLHGNSRVARQLKKQGFSKMFGSKGLSLWNPSGAPYQTVDIKEEGASAYALVLTKYGFNAYSQSRLD